MKLTRPKMRPFIDQVSKAALALLPITVVVAGAVIQFGAAVTSTDYTDSLLFVWVSALFFALAFGASLLYENSVPEEKRQAFDVTAEEKTYFWATLLLFGLGLLLFILSPAGLVLNEPVPPSLVVGATNVGITPGEGTTLGLLISGKTASTVNLYAIPSDSRLTASLSKDTFTLAPNNPLPAVLMIQADPLLPLGTYPVLLNLTREDGQVIQEMRITAQVLATETTRTPNPTETAKPSATLAPTSTPLPIPTPSPTR